MFRKSRFLLSFILIVLAINPAFAVAPITTQGNQVLIGGQQGSLAGNSFFWSNFGGDAYYNQNVVSWLKEDWNTTIVRAAMGVEEFNGYLSNRNLNLDAVTAVVDAAIAEDIYVIIDWHTHHAENNTNAAVEFFSDMAERYGDHDNVIFEIYNEPINTSWSDIKAYAAPVISAIRQHSDNLIVVGTPFFSQRVDEASLSPITGVDNLAYTLHFYAGTHGESLRNRARTALNNGIPLFVTEWGAVNADGNGGVNEASTREWMSFLEENNISHLNWAVNDKDEGASVLIGTEQGANNQGGWALSLLTQSGLLSRDIIRDWPAVAGAGDDNPDDDGDTNTSFPPITSLIEAEDFDSQSGIRVEATSDIGGGQNIGYIENNDYAEYNVNVPSAGVYTLEMRLASNTNGGDISLQINGNNRASLSVGDTGGWQEWVTVSTEVDLDAGDQTLRFLFTDPISTRSLLNVNWINFTAGEDQGNDDDGDNGEGDNGDDSDGEGDTGDDNDGQGNDDQASSVCEFVIVNEYSSGFVAEIRVTNNGAQAIDTDWSVTFKFTDGSQVVNSWNSVYQGDTASPLSWNRVIQPNGTTVFGFQANKAQINSAAVAPEVNGVLCN